MSESREYHANAVFVAAIDGFLVAHRTARLNDSRYTGLMRQLHTILEREECIGSQHGTLKIEPEGMRFLNGLLQGIDA